MNMISARIKGILAWILFLVIFSAFFSSCSLYKTFVEEPTEYSDIQYLKDASYTSLTGGSVVKDYLIPYNQVLELAGTESNISFYYSDASHKTSFFHHFFAVYVEEIRDSNRCDEILALFGKDDGCESTTLNGCYDIYYIKADERAEDIVTLLAYNREKGVIRYVIFYGKDVQDAPDPVTLIPWNIDLDWT